MGLSGIPVFKELFRLRSEITFPGKWKTWWRAGYYLWPPVAISCTHLLSGRNWGRGWLWVDTGRQLMNAMKFVPPAVETPSLTSLWAGEDRKVRAGTGSKHPLCKDKKKSIGRRCECCLANLLSSAFLYF